MKRSLFQRLVRLLIASSTVVLIWCGLLPWLANQPSQKTFIDRLEAQGIDASAMTYTELPTRLLLDNVMPSTDKIR